MQSGDKEAIGAYKVSYGKGVRLDKTKISLRKIFVLKGGDSVKQLLSLCRILEKFMKFCIGWMLLVMSVLAFTGVVTRYFFFYSITWLEEVTRYLMVWMTFMAGALAVNDESHINIDFVPNYINKRLRGFDANILLSGLILIGMAVFAYFNFFQIRAAVKSGVVSPVLKIPMWMMYCSTILCAVSSVVFCVKNIAVRMIRCRRGEEG